MKERETNFIIISKQGMNSPKNNRNLLTLKEGEYSLKINLSNSNDNKIDQQKILQTISDIRNHFKDRKNRKSLVLSKAKEKNSVNENNKRNQNNLIIDEKNKTYANNEHNLKLYYEKENCEDTQINIKINKEFSSIIIADENKLSEIDNKENEIEDNFASSINKKSIRTQINKKDRQKSIQQSDRAEISKVNSESDNVTDFDFKNNKVKTKYSNIHLIKSDINEKEEIENELIDNDKDIMTELNKNEEKEEKKEANTNYYGLYFDKSKEVSDFCSMNDDKYLGISFNNGLLELYENFSKNQIPVHSFEIMNESEGIKSIYKSTRNINNFFFCGKEKIKNIEFYNGYKDIRTIMEIIDKKKIFTFSLEQNNCIISCDSNNKLVIYDKENNKIGDITESIDKNGNKDIFSLNEIMNNIIYITFNKTSDTSSTSSFGRNSYFFNNEMEEPVVDVSRTSIKDQVDLSTKIIELDENTNGIKREHILSEKQHLIGTINQRLVLIRDDNFKSVILFDAKTFKNVQRFYFEEGEKPIFCSDLNRRENLTDFVLVSDKMKMLLQNIYDEEHRNVTQISGLKIKNSFCHFVPICENFDHLKRFSCFPLKFHLYFVSWYHSHFHVLKKFFLQISKVSALARFCTLHRFSRICIIPSIF